MKNRTMKEKLITEREATTEEYIGFMPDEPLKSEG